MNTKLIIVIVAALIAVAYSQCVNEKCVGENKPCGSDTNDFISCNKGLECSGGNTTSSVCNKQATLGGSCSSVGCYDKTYEISCSSGTCLYGPALGPAEDCSKVTAADYVSTGACVSGTCTTSGVCPGNISSSTGNCDGTNNFCPKGTWCNAGTCADRKALGATCASTLECAWSQICSGFGSTTGSTCGNPFSVAAGGSCSNVFECNTGLACFGGKCTQPTGNGHSCTVPSTPGQGDCPTVDYECVCNGKLGSAGKCFAATLSGNDKSAFISYTNCMNSNCNYDLSVLAAVGAVHTDVTVSYTPDSCAHVKCAGATNSLLGALGTGAGCGAASSVQILIAMIFSLVAIVLMF